MFPVKISKQLRVEALRISITAKSVHGVHRSAVVTGSSDLHDLLDPRPRRSGAERTGTVN